MSAENRLTPDETESLLHGISAEVAASGNHETIPTVAGPLEAAAAGHGDTCHLDGQRVSFASTAEPDFVA